MITTLSYLLPNQKTGWSSSLLKACEAIRYFLPDAALTNFDDEPEGLASRDLSRQFKKIEKTKWRSFSASNRLDDLGKVRYKMSDPGYVSLGGLAQEFFDHETYMATGKAGAFSLVFSFHPKDMQQCESLFVAIGKALEAYSGYFFPESSYVLLESYRSKRGEFPNFEVGGKAFIEAEKLESALKQTNSVLPDRSPKGVYVHRNQVADLGWINYWSEETCQFLEFSADTKSGELLENSYQSASGAWVVKLTADPLDLSRGDHAKIYADTYSRFGHIGLHNPWP